MRSGFFLFAIRKFFEVSLSLLSLVTLTFLFLRFLPGGPFDQEISPHPLVRDYLEKAWHLHGSVLDQYIHYIGALLSGDLGLSLSQPTTSVLYVLKQGLKQTLLLNLLALAAIYFLAFGISLLWVRYQRSFVSRFIEQALLVMISLPSLLLAPVLIYFFGFYLNILPVAFLSSPSHYVLPILALSLRPLAYITRILIRSLAEQMQSDYVRTAKAKGIGPGRIYLNHVLKNSLVPLLSYSGNLIVSMVSGSFLVELLFAIPGLGSEFISSLAERDYTVICGLTLFYGSSLIIVHLILDAVMRWVDPRMQGPA